MDHHITRKNRTLHGKPGQKQEEIRIPPVNYQIGHNGTHLLIAFPDGKVDIMALDDKGYEAFMANMKTAKEQLDKAKPN